MLLVAVQVLANTILVAPHPYGVSQGFKPFMRLTCYRVTCARNGRDTVGVNNKLMH